MTARRVACFDAENSAGGRLLAQTPPEVAKDDLDALELFATSGNAELREATRPLLAAVATKFPEVGRALASRLVDALLKTQPVGAPAHILALLRNELIPKTAQTVEVSRTAYEKDKSSFLDLLDAERSLRDVKLKYIQAVTQYEVAVADLERAVGSDLRRKP